MKNIKVNLIGDVAAHKADVACPVIDINNINNIIKYYNKHKPSPFHHYDSDFSTEENNTIKIHSGGIQIFNSGKRENSGDLNEKIKNWAGIIVVDVDSKNYKGQWEELLKSLTFESYLNDGLIKKIPDVYLGLQRSYSGNSYHIYFYVDCEKTYENFCKAGQMAVEKVNMVFTDLGLAEVIKTTGVVDSCTIRSPFQFIFITNYYFYINERCSGQCDLSKYVIEDTTEKIFKDKPRKITMTGKITFPKLWWNPFSEFRHHERFAFVSGILIYTKFDIQLTWDIYSKFIDTFLLCLPAEQNGGYDKKYYKQHFYLQIKGMAKHIEAGDYTISRKMLDFIEKNMLINIKINNKNITDINYDKCYSTKKIYKKSLCF